MEAVGDAERALTAFLRYIDRGTVARSADTFGAYLMDKWLQHMHRASGSAEKEPRPRDSTKGSRVRVTYEV
jgi:hypothetical protein